MSKIVQGVYANYDATTGAGSAAAFSVAFNFGYKLASLVSVNRATGTVIGIPVTPNRILQITGTTFALSSLIDGSNGASGFLNLASDVASNNAGHIYIALSTQFNPTIAGYAIYNGISDASPTLSNAWPGASGMCGAVDTLGTDVYGIDGLYGGGTGLYVMHGDGPAITLADGTIGSLVLGDGKSIIGDATNNGLWLLQATSVKFWSPTGPTTTNIPISGAQRCKGFCLDETAAKVYVLYRDSSAVNIAIINTSTKTVTGTISLASLPALQQCCATYGGYVWVGSEGGNNYSDSQLKTYLYRVKAADSTITTFDKTGDYSSLNNGGTSQNFVVATGRLVIPAYRYDAIAHGPAGVFAPGGTTLTDNTVDFVASGVQPSSVNGNLLVGPTAIGNPGARIASVATHVLTMQDTFYQNQTNIYWVLVPFPDSAIVADSSFSANFVDLAFSALSANSSVTAQLVDLVFSPCQANSSISATLSITHLVSAGLVADSSFAPATHEELAGMATLSGNSLLSPGILVRKPLTAPLNAGSTIAANATLRHFATASLVGNASVSEVLYHLIQGAAATGGNSNALGSATYLTKAGPLSPGVFTPAGFRPSGIPTPNSREQAEIHYRIVPPPRQG